MELKDLSAHDLEVLKAAVTSQGFTVNSGLHAIQLDALAKLAYNVFYPELRKIPHISPEMAGERWGGSSFQWKSILNPNATSLPAPVSPGNRNAIASITANSYSAPYTTLGYDQSVQDEEYEQERGFDDPLKNARITTMHNILRMYDIMVTSGNRGTATTGFATNGNGFALGTAVAPVLTTAATGGLLAASTKVTVYCVELTAYSLLPFINGGPANLPTASFGPAPGAGLVQTITRTPANATSSETIPAGTGIPSSGTSVTVASSTSTNVVVATQAAPTVGAFGWAWYVSVNASPTTANAYFYGVTSVPQVQIVASPNASLAQALSALAATDYSFNGASNNSSGALDFDGAFAWIANSQNSGLGGFQQFINLAGAEWGADGFGGVSQIELAIAAQFSAFQAVPDEIVCGTAAIYPISAAVLQGSGSNYRFLKDVPANGGISASGVVRDYRLKFSPDGEERILPISISPNIPPNAVWLPCRKNPFPSTSATIPAALQLAEIKPMYSNDYAKTRRTWELGTYVQTTLVNRTPFLGIVFSGASASLPGSTNIIP